MKRQALLPLVPDGSTPVNDLVSIVKRDDEWTWFYGARPVFAHRQDDRNSFRMFSAQLVCQGACKQVEIVKACGVSPISVKRCVKQFRQEGIDSFFLPRPTRSATVMTPDVIQQAQDLLKQGHSRAQTARQLGISCDTLRKAINQGRLTEPLRETHDASHNDASHKSQRGEQDVAAADGMGMACTRLVERVGAALGLLPGGASTQFQSCRDVTFGGVLCAMPALSQNGLFRHLDRHFPSLTGYYTTVQIISLLASMALCRIRTVEQLQYHPPGELGKLLGLDRVPEVRCLRNKLAILSENQAPEKWAARLSRDWLEADPDLAGALYVDGHVRLYHGKQTKLPRRYVARQRLCLRGTTDYWVNDALGQPFFAIERPVDQGMLEAIRNDIVPRLLADVPRQPTQQQLDDDPYLHRFVMLFDREGYSPAFFREMWQTHRIACITYHKYPAEAWPVSEFHDTPLTLPNGESVSLPLAERGSWIGSHRDGLWVREIRKLTASGHQTSLISSAYGYEGLQDAGALFSRWSQENFFRYAMQHFGIDLLSEYGTDGFPEPKRPVVNPARRELDTRRRSLQGRLTRQHAQYAALTLHPEADEAKLQKWKQDKMTLVESIEQLEQELLEVKQQQSATPKHLPWSELPEDAKFARLAPSRKHLMDTVKMLAYRAETSLAGIVREALSREDDARSLLQELFRQEADLHPDESRGELAVRIHPFSNPRSNRAIEHLLGALNESEMKYPGTRLTLTYSLIGATQN